MERVLKLFEGRQISLKTKNGKSIGMESNGDLILTTPEDNTSQYFTIVSKGNNEIALVGKNYKYLSYNGTKLSCKANLPLKSEVFLYHVIKDRTITIQHKETKMYVVPKPRLMGGTIELSNDIDHAYLEVYQIDDGSK